MPSTVLFKLYILSTTAQSDLNTFLTVWVIRDKYIAKYIEEKLSGETNNYIVYGDIQRQALSKKLNL